MEFVPTETEKIAYLTRMLDTEERLKAELAFELHASKTGIQYLDMVISDLQKPANNNSAPIKELDKLKEAVALLKNDVAKIYETYLRNPADKLGPTYRLIKCIQKLAEQFDGKIDFEHEVINEYGLEQTWTYAYYHAFSYAIEIVCHYGFRLVNIELTITQIGFQLKVIGQEPESIEINADRLEDCLEKLKTILIWKQGIVLPETNWKNKIVFQLPVTNIR